MHIFNRVRKRLRRTNFKKGFSLLELSAAIAVFGVLSGVVTLAIVRAQMAATEMRFERQVSSAMQTYLNQVSSSPYQTLFSGDFTRPSPCSYDYLSTCVTVWDRDIEITWGVEPILDPLTRSNDGSLAVKIVSSALVNNDILELEKVVLAPNGAWLGSDGVHRVNVSGSYDGILYLVNQSGSAVSSGSIVNGNVFFRVSSALCTESNPCRVALTPEGSYLYNGYGIDARSAVGNEGEIVILEGGITHSALIVKAASDLVVKLEAENDQGFISSPSVKGSVCIWLSFNDGVQDREIPKCNTEYADRVLFDYYTPTTDPGLKLGFLNGLLYSISVDKPSGGCPSISGALVHKSGLGWVPGSNCTSFTWGLADSYSNSDDSYSINESFTSLTDELTLLWSGENARPAAGYGYELRWSKPRSSGACVNDSSCTPVSSSLESIACPLEHCYSSASVAPVIFGPVRGEFKVPSIPISSSESKSISFSGYSVDSNGSDTTSVSFSSIPVGITPVIYEYNEENVLVENVITENEVFGSYIGKSGVVNVELRSSGSFGYGVLSVTLSGPGGVRDVDVALGNPVFPWSVKSTGLSIKQGGQSVVNVEVIGSDGELFSGADITASNLPLGVSSSVSVTTSSGVATLLLVASNPLVQSTSFNVVASFSGRSATTNVLLNITPTAGDITFTGTSIAQGGRGTLSAVVRDKSGNLLDGAVVTFEVADGLGLSKSVYAEPSGCVTDALGSCAVDLVTSLKSSAGSYVATVSSGDQSASDTILITQRVSKILAKGGEVRQGKFIDIEMTLLDGMGVAVSNKAITANSTSGLTLSAINNSGSDGKSVLRVTAGLNAAAGVREVNISSGGVTLTIPITILSRVAYISADPIYINQGGSESVVLDLLDPNTLLVKNTPVQLTASTGLTVPSTVRSGVDGKLRFSVLASSSAPIGDGSFSLSYDGVVIDTVLVNVDNGNLRVRSSGVVTDGLGERDVSFVVERSDKTPIVGANLVIKSENNKVLVLSSTCQSNSVGICVIPVNFSKKINDFYIYFTATANGKSYLVRVLVK